MGIMRSAPRVFLPQRRVETHEPESLTPNRNLFSHKLLRCPTDLSEKFWQIRMKFHIFDQKSSNKSIYKYALKSTLKQPISWFDFDKRAYPFEVSLDWVGGDQLL